MLNIASRLNFTRTLGSAVMLGIMLFLSLPAATYAVEIIIDNKEPGMSFSNLPGWHGQSLTSAYKGSTLRTFNKSAWSTFRFGSLASGKYDVYMYWPNWSGTLPDNAAPIVIKHSSGTQIVTVNQQQNGGQWNSLGSWTLDNTAYLTLTNRGNGPIYSDAVKLVPSLGTPPQDPTLSLTANPVQVGTGGTATLSWTSQNSTSCTASGGWSGSKGTSGSQTVSNITSSRTYSLTCAGTTKNISASVNVAVVSTPPPPPVQPALKLSSGVNGALWGGTDPVKAVDAMDRAGFNSMRLDLAWKLLEKKKGVFTWPSELARQRKAVSLQIASGMKPLVMLGYGNGLYPGTGKSQTFIDGFTRYAKWVATELKGSVRHFEVWNEWNGGIGLPCTYQDPRGICTGAAYVKLLCPVYAALKQVDPSIVVVGGATAGLDNRFIDGMIAGGGMKCLDVLSLHMYYYNKNFEPPEVTLSKLQSLQQRIKPIVGKEIPFYITETGVTVYPGGKHTLDEQADYLTRFHLAAKAYPFIQGIWPFSLTDVNARNPFQSSFGLMQRDFTPKPAYAAMQDVTGLFAEGEFLGKIKSASDVWLLKFRELNGSYTYAVWSTSTRTSTKLIFDAQPSVTLDIRKVGGDPIAVTKLSFKAGSNSINTAVSSAPRIIWASGANINITEAAK